MEEVVYSYKQYNAWKDPIRALEGCAKNFNKGMNQYKSFTGHLLKVINVKGAQIQLFVIFYLLHLCDCLFLA